MHGILEGIPLSTIPILINQVELTKLTYIEEKDIVIDHFSGFIGGYSETIMWKPSAGSK